jgi:hypothetical protein
LLGSLMSCLWCEYTQNISGLGDTGEHLHEQPTRRPDAGEEPLLPGPRQVRF